MKARKRLEHLVLIEEIRKLASFNEFIPTPSFIKNVIEGLINREYLARNYENKNIYEYIS